MEHTLGEINQDSKASATYLLKENGHEFSDQTPIKLLIQETRFEETFLVGRIPRTCLDVLTQEIETDLKEFLNEDLKDNIVFLFPIINQEELVAACYNRQYLLHSKIFYNCLKENSMDPESSVRLSYSIFQIQVREYTIYISQENMEMLLESKSQFFMVNETPVVKLFTVSKDVQDGREDMFGADHCQAGSDKRLSVILPISLESVNI